MTFWKADPLHWSAARGASCAKCSLGQSPARNSRRFVYSVKSVSPGENDGIKCHGRCDAVPELNWLEVVASKPSPSGMLDSRKTSLGSDSFPGQLRGLQSDPH